MKYKLLKDLPGYEAGMVFVVEEHSEHVFEPTWFNNTDWFEPVDDTPKAEPYRMQLFGYKLNQDVETLSTIEFRTQSGAQAAAEAIKALLEYIHTPYDYENPDGHISQGREKVFHDARKAVQEDAS